MHTKLLTTASVLTIVTTAAFAAPSVRTTPNGITSTVAGTIARAGTLRTTPARATSTTATKISTNPTASYAISSDSDSDERLAVISGKKIKIPSKTTDASLGAVESRIDELQNSAQQKLDELNSQINELQTQLANARDEQSTVLKEEDIDQKIVDSIDQKMTDDINQKISGQTYTKTQLDMLFAEIDKKLPKIDERGNLNLIDPNGTLVAYPLYYINLVNEQEHLLISFVQDQGMVSQVIANLFIYHTNKTDTAIQQYVSSTVCSGETSSWCAIIGINTLNDDVKEVAVLRLRHGGDLIASVPEFYGYTASEYWTFESSPFEYVRNMVCGNRPEEECFVDTNGSRIWDAMGEAYDIPGKFQNLAVVRLNKLARKYTDLVEQSYMADNILDPNAHFGTRSRYYTNMSAEEIEEYVSSTVCDGETSGSGWCVHSPLNASPINGIPRWWFMTYRYNHGYVPGSTDYITSTGTRIRNFVTMEDNAEQYVLSQVCGQRPESECHLAPNHQTVCRQQDLTPNVVNRTACSVYIEQSPVDGTAWNQHDE